MPLPWNVERKRGSVRTYIVYDGRGYAFRASPLATGRIPGRAGWEAKPSHAAAAHDTRRFQAATLVLLAERIGQSAPPCHSD